MISLSSVWRKRYSYVTVLDIGTAKICGLMVRMDMGKPVEVIGCGYAPAKGIRGGAIVDLDKATECVGQVLQQIERQADRQVKSVVINISSSQMRSSHLYREKEIPEGRQVTTADVKSLVDEALAACLQTGEEVLHAFPLGYVLDKEQGCVDPRGLDARILGAHIHVITIPEAQLRNLVLVLDRCHVSVETKVATPYAAALAVLSDEEKEIGATAIDMGAGATAVALFINGGLVHIGSLPVGGNALTRDIAQGLSTSLATAERLKTLNGAAFRSPKDELERLIVPVIGEEEGACIQIPRADLIAIIVPRLEEILEGVGRILDEVPAFGVAARRLVVCGGGSELQGLKEKTAALLEGNVRVGTAPEIKNLPNQFDSYTFLVCIGLLCYVSDSERRKADMSQRKQIMPKGRLGKVIQWIMNNF
jgi:cell division protein FtsA